MMTTMAALLGALPLALGTGVGSELRRPLGIAIVGGLIVSQMLTLYTTPVVYLYLDRVPAVVRAPPTELARPMAPRSSAGIVINGLHAENMASRSETSPFRPSDRSGHADALERMHGSGAGLCPAHGHHARCL